MNEAEWKRMIEHGCVLCRAPVDPQGKQAYSVCFDPCVSYNVWGGDSHEYVALLCDACGDRLKARVFSEGAES